MTCAELKQLLAAHALGALDAEDRAAVAAHLAEATHEGCREALAEAERTVRALGAALPPVAPDPGTWAAIEKQIGTTAAASAGPPSARASAGRPRRFVARALPWVLLAAAATVILWMRDDRSATVARLRVVERHRDEALTAVTVASTARQRCDDELEAARAQLTLQARAVAMLQLPATRVVSFAAQGQDRAGATAIVNLEAGRAMVLAHGVQPPAGKDYELWVIRGEQKIAAGLMRGSDTGEFLAEIDPGLLAGGADALAVTLEPEGGGTSPRGQLVLVATMPKT